jgi:CheY-like chemotaxis protein
MFAVSASASTEERERCREAGMVDLIAKPFSANTLLGRILPWLRPLDEEPAPAPVRPALRRAVSRAKVADAVAPVPAIGELPVEELLRLLDEGSLEAVDLARRHERALLVWLAPEQTQWTDALSRFDFISAAALLRERLTARTPAANTLTKETTSA